MSETGHAGPRGKLARRRLLGIEGSPFDGDPAPRPSSGANRAPRDAQGRFANPDGSPQPVRDGSAWRGFLWRRLVSPPPSPVLPEGHVLDVAQSLAGWAELAGADGIMWLGHASFLIRLGGLTILTDPFLGERASPFRHFGPKRYAPPGLPVERLPRVDLVLLSHNHYDHMDVPTLRRLLAFQQPALVCAEGVGRYLEGMRFADRRELGWFESERAGPVEIMATPAIHFSKRTLFDRNRTLWCGFMLRAHDRSIYFAGDTAFGPVFQAMAARVAPPDLALVPIGAYDPRPLMQAVHSSPEEGVEIARTLGARRICGMHWGTIMLTDEPPFEPPGRMALAAQAAGYAPEDAFVLPIGGSRAL